MDSWMDLNNIPKKHFGNKEVYDWKKSIGIICNFICDGRFGNLEIVGYDAKNHLLSVLYNNVIKTIKTGDFKVGKIRTLIGLRTNDFRVEIGESFIDEHRHLTILSRKYIKDSNGRLWKEYQYHCHKCNWEDGWIKENHLLNGTGCSCCSKHTIVPFVNDLYTTNPELIKYFKNIEDTHKTTSCSKKKFLMICPNCGNEQLYSTDDLMNHGFSCRKCCDGISYGEKFVYSLLKQLEIDFISQLTHTTFAWCKNYRYDFYLPKYNTIIEVNGSQHYCDNPNPNGKFGSCLISDPIKEKLAKENNIDNYIHIDCSKSECSYIHKSIKESALFSIIGASEFDVDWESCDKFTSKSLIVDVCKYKNSHPELSARDIGKTFGMANTTIQKYLQKGAVLGICIYDKDFEKRYRTKEARINYYLQKQFNFEVINE